MESNARFRLKDARIIRVKELPKVAFITVLVQSGKFADYQEVVAFQPPPFALLDGLAVTINGELSKRKPKEGSKEWTVQLVARGWEMGDEAKAPRPKRSGERQNRPNPHADVGMGEDTVDW